MGWGQGSGGDSNGELIHDNGVYISMVVAMMGGSGVVVAMVGSWGFGAYGVGAREWG